MGSAVRSVLVLLLFLAHAVGPIAQNAPAYAVRRIDAAGVQRFTAADIARVSGLTIGQSVTIKALDEAAAAMAGTGLFRSVRYRFATDASGGIAITFEIEEEPDWSIPVVYDNFIWIDDADLDAAVRELVPAFSGTAPANGRVPELITRALTGALRARGIDGQVSYTPKTKLDGTDRQHIFTVEQPAPALCALHIDGAVRVKEAELLRMARDVIAKPYSRHYVVEFASKTLVQAYHDRGYWRAAFQVPAVAPGSVGACRGALVTIHVDEGVQYRFQRTSWIGNRAVTRGELDQRLGLPSDVLAEAVLLRSGLDAVASTYRQRGYLNQTATPRPVFDEDARRVSFEITIDEGPQFRMGTLSIDGVPARQVDALVKKWKLKAGDVFDASYPGTFQQRELAGLTQGGQPIVVLARPNQASHVVDVVVGPRR